MYVEYYTFISIKYLLLIKNNYTCGVFYLTVKEWNQKKQFSLISYPFLVADHLKISSASIGAQVPQIQKPEEERIYIVPC